MKNKASTLLKHIISVLSSVVKAVRIKSKTNATGGRLIMLSLMKNKKVLMDSLSHKIDNLLGQHDMGSQDHLGEQSKAIVLYSNGRGKDNQTNTNLPENVRDEGFEVGNCNDDKYPDLTHSLFDQEELDYDQDGCASIIDVMRNSKEEEGQNFSLEARRD